MCLIDAQLIFYPLATFALVFFGIKIYKNYRSTNKNIVNKKSDDTVNSIGKDESLS